jgi:type IV pilus assembly protein PilV
MSRHSINNIKVMNKRKSPLQNEHGFTLLEALIGFLILSIGMLGIASLQAISLKTGKTSVYGSVAMMKVDELLESMRANSSAEALAAYEAAGDGAGASHGCAGAAICSAENMAQEDVFWWKQNLKAGLPGAATTAVEYTPPGASSKMATVTITVTWAERKSGDSGSVTRTYTTTANICTAIPC